MQVYVFTYKWWRIMEGLTYKIYTNWTDASKAPEGSYLYLEGRWWQRRKDKNYGATVINFATDEHQVPREIRTTLLLIK